MKVCPVCNESFAADLKFCDVDGARLKRRDDGSADIDQSKLWQLLGVGLLLGALAISAISVFLPRGPAAPAKPSTSISVQPTSPSVAEETPATQQPPPALLEDTAVTPGEIALAETRKRERALAVSDRDSKEPGPNPKAAALAAEESATADRKEDDSQTAPSLRQKGDITPAKADSEPATGATVTDPRSARKAAAETRTSGKESTSRKKAEEKDKEKRGGFLRMFKKIFGKG